MVFPLSHFRSLAILLFLLTVDARADTVVVFNEIHYHPAAVGDPEWIELHNQMAYDVDLSGWRLSGGIDRKFAEGTVIPAGGYLVVSPPWNGSLSNGGERLRLRNNSDRIMDEIEYGDGGIWPVGADGSGATLAKRDPDTASAPPENWRASVEIGGTPGADNFPAAGGGVTTETILVAVDSHWRYDESGAGLAAGWAAVGHPGWPSGTGLLGYETAPAALPTTIGTTFANPAANAVVTYYFETEFTLDADQLGRLASLAFRHVIDDGAVFYLNGTEIGPRFNMPAGPIGGATLANGTVGNAAWQGPFDLPAALLVEGANRFSAEVHQQAANSSDVIFGAEITGNFTGTTPPSTTLRINEISGTGDANFRIELLNTGQAPLDASGFEITSRGTTDHTFVLPAGISIESGGYLVLEETTLGFRPTDGDPLFLYDARRARLLDAARADVLPKARSDAHGGRLLVPDAPTFGAANTFSIEEAVVINEIMYHFRDDPGVAGTPAIFGTLTLIPIDADWRYDESGQDAGAAWASSAHPAWPTGPALLGYETTPAALPESLRTTFVPPAGNAITTYYFEREFVLDAAQVADLSSLRLRHIIDDGAVFYLNGVEAVRFNMPDGPIGAATLADPGVPNALYEGPIELPTGSLLVGTNRFSVEVHQQFANSSDVVFGAELTAVTQTAPGTPARPVVERDEEWIELFNRGGGAVDLSGWSLDGGIDFDFPAGTVIPGGGFLVVARDAPAMAAKYPALGGKLLGNYGGSLGNGGDAFRLEDAVENPVDEIRYHEGGRWPDLADGGGSSLELRDVDANNAVGGAWAASDESGKSAWQTITYRGTGGQSYGLTNWNEFRLGMLQDGVVLIDDVRVTRDPDGAAQPLIQNGTFSSGTDKWRLLGNHRHSEVVPDPGNPGNMVLRLDARGSTDTRHNHLETTLVGNAAIQAGQTYEVSFRARWVSGSNLLNSRCYYQRLARTTQLARPESCGTPGAPNSRLEANIGPTFARLRHDPPVPAAGQPVTVRADVTDPDGLGTLVLKTRVNGGAAVDFPFVVNTEGHGAGVIPGQAGGTIVQFWIEATDALGTVSMEPPGGPDSRALVQTDDGQGTALAVSEIRLVMLPFERDFMLAPLNLMSNERTGCTAIYRRSEIFYDASVRLRGSGAGRARDGANYRGFNIGLPADHLFRGVHDSLSIDRSARTPAVGQQHEIYVKHMFNRAGIPCMFDELIYLVGPSATYTGTSQMLLAGYGSHFTETQFENGGNGSVFNLDITYDPVTTLDGNPESLKPPTPFTHVGTDITDLGDSGDDYRTSFDLRTGRGRDDYSGLIRFCKTMALPAAQLDAEIGGVMDVDEWMRYTALTVLCGIGDTFAAGGLRHNIRIFVPEDGIGVAALPWDMDFVFSAGTTSSMLPMTGNLRRVADIPRYRRLYWGHVHDLVQTTFNTGYMGTWLSHYGSVLNQPFSGQAGYISARGNFALSQLPTQVPFGITTNGGTDFSTPGTTAVLEGKGWVNVRTLRLAGRGEPLDIEWLDAETWRVRVPVAFGANAIALEAYDFREQLIGSANLVITSTATASRVADFLRITELHYHPANPETAAELAAGPSDSDFEFIELRNTGPETLALDGVRFDAGVKTTLGDGTTLGAGQFAVVVRNRAAFAARYGTSITILGDYPSDALANGGELLVLRDRTGTIIQSFAWDDAWFPATDGPGWSMVARAESGSGSDLGEAAAWGISVQKHGNPGAPNGAIFASQIEGWRHRHFTASELDDPSISSPDAMIGGLSNLLRYGLGLTPTEPGGPALPTIAPAAEGVDFTYRRLVAPLDLVYTVESSPDLFSWLPVTTTPIAVSDNGDGTESVTLRFASDGRRFARMRIAQP